MADDALSIEGLLKQTEAFSGSRELADVALRLFEYTQFLLDGEENLTRTGNLNVGAREALQRRALELLGVSEDEVAGEPEPEGANPEAPNDEHEGATP